MMKINWKRQSLQVCNFFKKRLQYRCFPVSVFHFLTKLMLCLYEAGTLFIPSRQGRISLEAEDILGEKISIWIICPRMILKECYHVIRSSQWMRTKIKTRLADVTDKVIVEPCLIFFQNFVMTTRFLL